MMSRAKFGLANSNIFLHSLHITVYIFSLDTCLSKVGMGRGGITLAATDNDCLGKNS